MHSAGEMTSYFTVQQVVYIVTIIR